jgi:probable DNA metabolism protein
MIIFRYDKTFEGLLTAVFDAYSRRTFPDALLAEGDPGPLFVTEDYTVVTDPEKSGRVWRALEKRLPKEVCNMLMLAWLTEEDGVDEMLVRYMRRVIDSKTNIATDFTDPDVLRVKQLAHKVSNERQFLMMFTRFQKGGDNTYFAPVAPRYNALPLAIPFFRDRFGDQRWLIYDIKRRYGFYYDLETVTEVTMEDDGHLLDGKLDERLMAEDEKLFQSLWKSYFKSMAIKERINPKLQRQHMPRRFWKLLTELQ